jgi:hypothetical protein
MNQKKYEEALTENYRLSKKVSQLESENKTLKQDIRDREGIIVKLSDKIVILKKVNK